MDLESTELLKEESPDVTEEPIAPIPEQPVDTIVPREDTVAQTTAPLGEAVPTDATVCTPETETPVYPTQESPTTQPHESGLPYNRAEQGYTNGGYPYGNASGGSYPHSGAGNSVNPYQQGYYSPTSYGPGYAPGQVPYYGGNYVPLNREAAYAPPAPYSAPPTVVRKNNKTIGSLIVGVLAMGVLNFMPFVALILSIIAICTGYTGLKQGELTKGKRICGFIGLALGIISLILSVTMLIMLLTLFVQAMNSITDSANSIIR